MPADFAGGVVLVVEDVPLIAADIAFALEDAGAKPAVALSFADAYARLAKQKPVAAIVDHVSADGQREKFCAELKRLKVPFVIYSGHTPEKTDVPYVLKPAPMEALMSALAEVVGSAS